MSCDTRNLQNEVSNEFFNTARKEKTTVSIYLGNGIKLVGRLKSFDRFTLLLESHKGEQIVFKHAISTVSACARPAEAGAEEQHRGRATAVGGRSHTRD